MPFLLRKSLISSYFALLRPRPTGTPVRPSSISSAMATARQQPPWQQPSSHPESASHLPPLRVWNSLTKSKVPFVPIDPNGRNVTWYACGPTVYDDAHLGHARNYVSTDILRRIMRDYFKFNVRFVMNITDVDDKVGRDTKAQLYFILRGRYSLNYYQIITRGRQQHLFAQYILSHPSIDDEVINTVREAYKSYINKALPLIGDNVLPEDYENAVEKAYAVVSNGGALDGSDRAGDKEAKIKMHIKTVSSASKALVKASKETPLSEAFYHDVQDVLLPYLDAQKASTVDGEDYSIFTGLTKRYEDRFMEDVRDLNVLDPDDITRVTEYISDIVGFVDKIVKNKFGYVTSDGSVYFDINSFESSGIPYARLEPWNRNDANLLADGEGSLARKSNEKRSDADFALWKASKPGEPRWPSPWGGGRPGWHIECSAMASARLGKQMDIHSGGIDLAFPHHDNELAQSEAYWHENCGHDQWVNYFFHMGHLSIQGSKMSKSLKNFTTIREALERRDWTPRSLRIVFLLGGWKEGVEITEELVKAGNSWEEKVNNFFIKVKDTTNSATPASSNDGSLAGALKSAEETVYQHLCDSFNTPGAMYAISELISKYNSSDKAMLNVEDVQAVARWVTRMVNIFGLNGTASPDTNEIGWSGIDIPEAAKPYLYPLSSMRDSLRQASRSQEGLSADAIKSTVDIGYAASNPAQEVSAEARPYKKLLDDFSGRISSLEQSDGIAKEVLNLCDRVRDIDLFDLGVYLEDRDNQPALVRPVTKELIQAREEKAARAQQKQLEKEKREKEALKKAEKGKISHLDMFRTSEYSAWDEDGIPIKDAAGEEIAKSKNKKLRKDWERQKKAHETWLASTNKTDGS